MKKSTLIKMSSIISIAVLSGCSSEPTEEFPEFDISSVSCNPQPDNTDILGAKIYLQKETLDKSGNGQVISKQHFEWTGYLEDEKGFDKEHPFFTMSSKHKIDYISKVEVTNKNGVDNQVFKTDSMKYGLEASGYLNKDKNRVFFNLKDTELTSMEIFNVKSYAIGLPKTAEVEISGDVTFGKVSDHLIVLSPTEPPLSMSLPKEKDSRSYKLIACPIYFPSNSSFSK